MRWRCAREVRSSEQAAVAAGAVAKDTTLRTPIQRIDEDALTEAMVALPVNMELWLPADYSAAARCWLAGG